MSEYGRLVHQVAQYFEIPLHRVWLMPFLEFELLAAAMMQELEEQAA